MSNSHKDDFERMIQLAEFGAKRHDERRQVEFRVFIAYMTLLALAFYQKQQILDLNLPLYGIVIALGFIHFLYFLWQIRLSRALVNDAWRRNFYLKKAECILHHLMQKPKEPFCPSDTICVTITLGNKVDKKSKCPEKGKMLESELFDMHEPYVVLVSPMLRFWKHWGQVGSDWSRLFQILIPTIVIILLILALYSNKQTWWQRLIQG